MNEKLDLILLDDSNKIINQVNIEKPESYKKLLSLINKSFKLLSNKYIIFYESESKEKRVSCDKEYKDSKNILFIRNISFLKGSVFSVNYNKLPDLKKEELDEKYTCLLCSENIKDENPYICYICQKIFHKKCLKDWEIKRKNQKLELSCPNCRNELPLSKWKEKLDYIENRQKEADIMNKLNENELSKALNENINKINEQKINELKKQLNEIKKNEKNNNNNNINNNEINNNDINNNINVSNILNMLAEILIKINDINSLIKPNNDLIKEFPGPDKIYNVIWEGLERIENYIYNKRNIIDKNKMIIGENKESFIEKNIQFKNKINLIYNSNQDKNLNIFGEKFVSKNKDKIDLIINGEKSPLVSKYSLKKGDNIITLIINKELTSLEYMFYNCSSLKNIEELKYLNTENITNFSNMFYNCIELTDIESLREWNVSKVTDFSYMFNNCISLLNLRPLKKWNVSSGTDFSGLFCNCTLLIDLTPLEKWDVSNSTNLSNMFYNCKKLSNIDSLKYWNVSKNTKFIGMFSRCSILLEINSLKYWNVSSCEDFSGMFSNCISLLNIEPVKFWDVSKCNNFSGMLYNCLTLSNIKPLTNWDVSNCQDFTSMLGNCPFISDKTPLNNWNIEKKILNDIFQ